MPIRELQLPQDLAELAEMLPDSFQYPENPEWSVQEDEQTDLESSITSLKKNWWLFQIGRTFFSSMRNILSGFVWEEDGKMAGCAILQPRGQSSQWIIGTIATHPQYRRRGIAQQLVTASLDHFRKKQGTVATLSVISGNIPAYRLYQKMGLEAYSGHYDIEFKPSGTIQMPELPSAYQLRKSKRFDWRSRFELHKRITPPNLQKFSPLEKSRFKPPVFMRLLVPMLSRSQKIEEETHLITDKTSGQLVGILGLRINNSGQGRHGFSILLDPEHSSDTDKFLLYALHRLSTANPELIIESGLPIWQDKVYDAAQELEFTTRLTYHSMGMILN